MSRYEPAVIESKWQKHWAAKKAYRTADAARDNFMLLVEFPYPSGDLHIGHWYTFAVSDIKARHLRMTGHNVMYPIGFDAFGLPAENAAIKNNSTPQAWTTANIARMTRQLESMGASFDWSRAVDTSQPEYYRWTQWIFLKLYERGLAYRAKTKVNWCPKDMTVLANEQVTDGCCERCDTPVMQRDIEQWMFKTTAFADALIDGIKGLDWPQTTRLAQENWIGRSEGTLITFPVKDFQQKNIDVFTTRADTLFGVTAVVVSPEIGQKWLENGWQASDGVRAYIKEALAKRELDRLEEKEKTGVPAGITAINPANDAEVPVWIADYVLGNYGTGAVMMVPAHDERDYEFAQKHHLPIVEVVAGGDVAIKAYTEDGVLVRSGAFNGMTSEDARTKITEFLKQKNLGDFKKTYRLRDWVLSRQRYWGCPIPIVHCETCGYVPVPEKELPIVLPPLDDFKPADDGRSPLAKAEEWLHVLCPKCGEWAERETDTMDTFVDSSWYFLRYTDPKNNKKLADQKKMEQWLPVPLYIGGPEHNTMHLLYARFITKALHEAGVLTFDEPFTARRNHSVILGADGNRMSKSRGNVVDPDKEVATYGADVVRMYLAFMGPYADQTMPWDPKGIVGLQRFLQRVWDMGQKEFVESDNEDTTKVINQTIKKVGEDVADLRYNTAISAMMIALNAMEAGGGVGKKEFEAFLRILAPFAPHLTEELWHEALKHKKSIHEESWPKYDPELLIESVVQVPVQVNGKVRGIITLAPDAAEQDAVFAAKQNENVAKFLEGKEPVKTVYIAGKLLNLVVK